MMHENEHALVKYHSPVASAQFDAASISSSPAGGHDDTVDVSEPIDVTHIAVAVEGGARLRRPNVKPSACRLSVMADAGKPPLPSLIFRNVPSIAK